MKKVFLLMIMFFCSLAVVMAQNTVSGKVTDGTGEGLPGVNVVIQGTTTGDVTDFDGNYQLSVDDGTTLVFSYVGFETQEIEVGSRTNINVSLSGATELEEVVVTALGITKEKASLGYGVAAIDREQIAGRQEADVARLLRGKATGVNITQTSGLAGSGTNIIIRGYSTITGSNQPLFVVDGIPFNTETNTGAQGFGSGGATASSRFLDLDPNTIDNISILKGLSATVLYGEAGRNGVVLVTTKNGNAGANAAKKTEVSFTQGIFQSQIANVPEYQDTYGNGFSGGFGWFFSNWGAAFDDLRESTYGSNYVGTTNGQVQITHPYDQSQYNNHVPQFIDVPYTYQPYESVENFFERGLSSNTSLSLSSKVSENASISATYSLLSEEGFLPNLDDLRGNGRANYIDKHNFGLGAQTKLTNGLQLKGSFNYVKSDRLSPITAPAFGGDGNGLFAALLFTPRSVDLLNLPYQSPIDGSNIYYRRGSAIQNPLWTLNNSGQSEKIDRFFSSTQLFYELTDNISFLYRLSLDRYDQTNRRHINRGGPRVPDGSLSTFKTANTLTDHIFNVVYNFDLTSDLNIDGIIGFNGRREVRQEEGLLSSNQFIYNLNTHENFIDHTTYSGITGIPTGFGTRIQNQTRNENTLGAYATASLGYKHYLFLNLQARNDWTSVLEQDNRSVLYPSASLSFVPTDAFSSLSSGNTLGYLKLRFSVGTSAGYPPPYSTRSVLSTATNAFVDKDGTVLNLNSVSNVLGNENLTRELFVEYEGGVEANFLDGRIGIDLSLYRKESRDLIIALPLDPSTGYNLTTTNAAKVSNQGIELGINLKEQITRDLQWTTTINYTKNISETEEILEGVNEVQVAGYNTGGLVIGNYAIKGQPFGVLYGESFKKNDEGLYIVDAQGNYQASGEFEKIGDPNRDFTINWINGFSWKNISFGFQWEYIKGGDIYSSTVQALLARGNTIDTDVDRDIPLILPNAVKEVGDGKYEPNDIQTYIGDSFFRAYFFAQEGGIFDGTVIRLREVSLAYVLPKKVLENTPFGRLGITLSGENLFYNAPNFPKGTNFDPELSSTGVGNGRGLDFRTAPTARKYGVTLTATF